MRSRRTRARALLVAAALTFMVLWGGGAAEAEPCFLDVTIATVSVCI